jgi:hypothetical protein
MIIPTPDRKEVELKDIGWIHLAQVLKTVMKKFGLHNWR